MSQTKYRLVTRSDSDGLVCGVLLSELGMIDDVLFVHPKDMQDGKIDITGRDITTNLPYTPQAFLVLDLRHEATVWVVNRFMIYALFPTANISMHVMPGMQQQNTVLAVGNLMLAFGGGGHQASGTSRSPTSRPTRSSKH